MKINILYFGGVTSEEEFDKTIKKSKIKPSSSSETFELSLIKGIISTGLANIDVCTAQVIATYPNGYKLFLRKKKDEIFKGQSSTFLSAINLPLIKPICFSISLLHYFKKWEKKTKHNCRCVLTYGLNSYSTKKLLDLCEKNNIKCFCILTDSPSFAIRDYSKLPAIGAFLKNHIKKIDLKSEKRFDAYIVLTKYYANLLPNRPSIVVEAITNDSVSYEQNKRNKFSPFVVMYAGTLYKKYGIQTIVAAFKKISGNYELWLFGSGDYESEIHRETALDSRIKYFGRVPRKEILEFEKKASLLLNTRSPDDEYTYYSFPSKMTEYMLSGTPVLTTKLKGIPDEYFKYVFVLEDSSEESIINAIIRLSKKDLKELNRFGEEAANFVSNRTNYKIQGQRIMNFISSVIKNENNSNKYDI